MSPESGFKSFVAASCESAGAYALGSGVSERLARRTCPSGRFGVAAAATDRGAGRGRGTATARRGPGAGAATFDPGAAGATVAVTDGTTSTVLTGMVPDEIVAPKRSSNDADGCNEPLTGVG